MPVSIRYMGRLGNNIIQYARARIFAEDNNLELTTPWCWPHFFQATPCASGAPEAGCAIDGETIWTDHNLPSNAIYIPKRSYVFQGYFQDSHWIWPARDRIRNFFRFPQTNFDANGRIQLNYSRMVPWTEIPRNDLDLGIHVRLTDGATLAGLNHIIHPEWYEEILSKVAKDYRRVAVLTDDVHAWGMFNVFKKYNAEVKSQTVPEDFIELMTFRNYIFGPSTFSYTSGLLGHAQKVWVHDPFITIPEVDLFWPGAVKIRGSFQNGRCR